MALLVAAAILCACAQQHTSVLPEGRHTADCTVTAQARHVDFCSQGLPTPTPTPDNNAWAYQAWVVSPGQMNTELFQPGWIFQGSFLISGPIMLNGKCTASMTAAAISAASAIYYAWQKAGSTIAASPAAKTAMNSAIDEYAAKGGIAAGASAAYDLIVAAVSALGVGETLALAGATISGSYLLYEYISCLASQ